MAVTEVIKVGNQPGLGRRVIDLTLDYDDDATTITGDIDFNGTIYLVQFVVPDLNAGTQCTLSFEDEDGNELPNSSGLVDESQPHNLTPGFSFGGGILTAKVVTAENQIADRDFQIIIHYA